MKPDVPPMRRMTVAVTQIEYQTVRQRAQVYGHSASREGGILISRALQRARIDDRERYVGSPNAT